jgi:hypothetical protein
MMGNFYEKLIENGAYWWNDRKIEIHPTGFTWTVLGANPVLHGEKPATASAIARYELDA